MGTHTSHHEHRRTFVERPGIDTDKVTVEQSRYLDARGRDPFGNIKDWCDHSAVTVEQYMDWDRMPAADGQAKPVPSAFLIAEGRLEIRRRELIKQAILVQLSVPRALPDDAVAAIAGKMNIEDRPRHFLSIDEKFMHAVDRFGVGRFSDKTLQPPINLRVAERYIEALQKYEGDYKRTAIEERVPLEVVFSWAKDDKLKPKIEAAARMAGNQRSLYETWTQENAKDVQVRALTKESPQEKR